MTTQAVIDRYVRYRVCKESRRRLRGPGMHSNGGHAQRSSAFSCDQRNFDDSLSDRIEDHIGGLSSYDSEDTVRRRTVSSSVVTSELSPDFDRVVRALTEEFEQRYEEVFQCALNELFLTQDNARTVFVATVNSMFADQVINWGRIIALLSFSGAVAAECVDKEMPNLVDQVISWTSSFVDLRLISWIQLNKGWNGLVEFYANSTTSYSFNSSQVHSSSWPTLRTLCRCAFGAIGVLTLGALLTQK